jgi:alkaline phosphatase D
MSAHGESFGRRRFLIGGAAAAGVAALPFSARSQLAAPAIIARDAARPGVPSGVQTGDLTADRAMLWSRSDRPSRMLVEWSTDEQFKNAERIEGPLALEDSDFTARIDLAGLPSGADIHYRVRFRDAGDVNSISEPLTGRFRTPPADKRSVSFVFSGDETGQGWGIDPSRGGLRMYETMRATAPDFFIHAGDQIYADQPLPESIALADGTTWRNVMTPAKAKVAETLADFRGNYTYNLADENKRRFLAEVPIFTQWDDHDVKNNWFPGQSHSDGRYKTKSVSLLAAYGRRSMFEYNPFRPDSTDPERVYRKISYGGSLEVFLTDVRSERGPNTDNRQKELTAESAFMGTRQLAWLKESLKNSKATWKVIACTLPISVVNLDYNKYVARGAQEGWANEDNGPPLGRELELADLLSFIKRNNIQNIVWTAADVHYAAAIHHDPARAAFTEFSPFWQFIAGPIHAGTYGMAGLDMTFGPQVRFKAVEDSMAPNRPPTDGLQFFGHFAVDGPTQVLTVRLMDINGKELFKLPMEPADRA